MSPSVQHSPRRLNPVLSHLLSKPHTIDGRVAQFLALLIIPVILLSAAVLTSPVYVCVVRVLLALCPWPHSIGAVDSVILWTLLFSRTIYSILVEHLLVHMRYRSKFRVAMSLCLDIIEWSLLPPDVAIGGLCLTISEIWIPSCPKRLHAAEDAVIDQYCQGLHVTRSSVVGIAYVEIEETLNHPKASQKPILLLCHGYMGGNLVFARSFRQLATCFRVFSIDWLGMAGSDRPFYTARNVAEAEDFFIRSLEAWRTQLGLEKFYLGGHSFGGYLAAHYALRFPHRVEQLVLISPVGMGERKVTDSRMSGRTWTENFFSLLWRSSVTPQSMLRLAGPVGKLLVKTVFRARFSKWGFSEREVDLFAAYLYHANALPGSGEFALHSILTFRAFAKQPVGRLLGKSLSCDTSFLYGETDWMNHEHALAVIDELRDRKVAGLYPRQLPKTVCFILKEAGHQLYLERPNEFARLFLHVTGMECLQPQDFKPHPRLSDRVHKSEQVALLTCTI